MEAKELMIDDWVLIDKPDKYAGAKAQIKSLRFHQKDDGQYFEVFICDSLGILRREVLNEDLRPILLTAEILEKNGFIRYGTSYILKESMFELTNPSNPDRYLDNYYIRLARQNKRVMYVHKLQHFMREFGIEKEIEI